MHFRMIFALLALSSVACLADDAADRAKLGGSWEQDGGASKASWVLEPTADGVHFVYTVGSEKVANFSCNTLGTECAVKISGKGAKVSVYFAGPGLVMMETRGDTVVKRRFVAAAEGQMEVESTPIVPAGKADTQHFKRSATQAASR